MKLLLTGATGYLGKKLLARLHEYDVICPCVPGTEAAIESFHNATVLRIDDSELMNSIKAYAPEIVINVAGVYDTQPFSSVLSGNLTFPLTIMEALSQLSLARWVNINTSLPTMLSSYSLSKHQLGDWGQYYSRKFNYTFIDIYLEQFYGPFDGRFLAFVIKKLLANEPLELTECLQRRDIIHVDDVCTGILTLIKAEAQGYMKVPLGSGEAPMLREVVEFCKNYIQSKSQIQYGAVPMRQGEPMLSIADTTIMSGFGFSPEWNWKAGLQNIIEEMKS